MTETRTEYAVRAWNEREKKWIRCSSVLNTELSLARADLVKLRRKYPAYRMELFHRTVAVGEWKEGSGQVEE